jgi:FkbM family methyltransferase
MKIFFNDNVIDVPIGTSVEHLINQLGGIIKQPNVSINNEVVEAASYSKVIKEKDVVNVIMLGTKRYKPEELGSRDRFYRFRKQFKVKKIYKLKYYLYGLLSSTPIETVKCSDGFLKFYCPNLVTRMRASSLLTKETDTIDWINEMPKGDCLWDIGANVGVFSLYACLRGINVISFEPLHSNYHILCKNVEVNNFSNKILAFKIALSDETKLDFFYIKNVWDGASGNTFGDASNIIRLPFHEFSTQPTLGYTIYDFMNTFNVAFPNYIKIDVDGIENKILKGGIEILKDERLKSMLVEIDILRNGARDEIVTLLGENGFKLVQINGVAVNENKMVFPPGRCCNYLFIR